MMVTMSLFPSGILQVWDVLENGYWHARSLEFIGSDRSRLLEWLRMPGDVVFIVFGAVPLVIAATKAWMDVLSASNRASSAGAAPLAGAKGQAGGAFAAGADGVPVK